MLKLPRRRQTVTGVGKWTVLTLWTGLLRLQAVSPNAYPLKLIPLENSDRVAIVDQEDHAELALFKWRLQPRGNSGYAYRAKRINGRIVTTYMHRVILWTPDEMLVDHRNGNGLDNRRANLRAATHAENQRNRVAKPSNTGFRGVTFDRSKGNFIATIRDGKKKRTIGRFKTAETAAVARDEAARRLHGSFAILNYPGSHSVAASKVRSVLR